MTIGDIARLTGLTESTLRFYERKNLLTVERDASGRRVFDEHDLAWIQFIRRLKQTGMPLKDIERYAALRMRGEQTTGERLQMLQSHRAFILAQRAEWEECLNHLDDKIAYYQQALCQ